MSNIQEQKTPYVQKVLFEEVQKKFSETITTTDELKIAIWAPVSKISPNSSIYKDFITNERKRTIKCDFKDIAEIEVSGEILTQTHKDIVDAIFSTNKKLIKTDEGDIVQYISVYEVLKIVSNSPTNYSWLTDKIDEIKRAVITLRPKIGNNKSRVSFNIFNTIYYDADKEMYAIVLNKEFVRFFVGRLTMDYSKHLPVLAKLKGEGNGFIKAAIRFFVAQKATDDKPYHIKLSTLLEKLDQPRETTRQMTSAQTYVNKYKDLLETFSIEFNKSTKIFIYHGAKNLKFTKSLFDEKKSINAK